MHGLAKLKWAFKLLGARYFIVLTDKESVIALRGARPQEFNDILALKAQVAALEEFDVKLKLLRKLHDAQVDKLLGPEITTGRSVSARKKKIPVKEG